MGLFGLGRSKKAKELDEVMKSMELAFENNYKDNATANLKKLEDLYLQFAAEGKLKKEEMEYFQNEIDIYKEKLKNFNHKKPAQW